MAAEASFRAQLRRYRDAAGLSQEDLAERAGLTASAIKALERGARRRPYPHTVQLLAAALSLDDAQRAAFIAAVPRRAATPSSKGSPHLQPDLGRGRTSFVGREAEMAALRARLEEACRSHGGVVMLVGDAGIGKTRLAREFAAEATSRGALCLWGCCFEGDWQPPYGPWVEALTAYVRSRPAEALRQELGLGASAIARLVPEVQVALRGVPVPSTLSPDEERFRLYDAVIRFLLRVSEELSPVLLVLDDLHWADPDSLRLLRHLARFVEHAPLLVVGAYRDPEVGLTDEHPLMSVLSVLRREADYERIVVHGFSRAEVSEYLAQTAGTALSTALVKRIDDETGGNPFYAREVFRHLAEEAKVQRRGESWAADSSIRELGIPEGVREVVGRRVARLSDQTGAMLRLAAGFSGGFGFDVLQALSEQPEQALLSSLDEALRAGLIRESGQNPPRYEFAHAIVRHALYEGLNLDRRARLHRRIALALEQIHRHEESSDAELAWQYYSSAALPGAEQGVAYALRAAEQAKAAYAHERAASFLRMARDLSADGAPEDRVAILRQLAVAEAEAVELDSAERAVLSALEAMSAAELPPRSQAEFLVTIVRALKDGGASPSVWEPLVERGRELTGGVRDLLWARLSLLQDHYELIESGPVGGARWLGHDSEAVAIARREGDEVDYARTLDPLDWRTREETEAVLALARSWTSPIAIMRALDVAGRDLLYRHGEFQEARAVYEELLAASERFGSIPSQAEALTHLATSQMALGDLGPAQETVRRAHEVIDRLGTGHRTHRWVAISRAIVVAYLLDGDWQPLAKEAVEYATGVAARHSPVGMMAGAVAALSATRAGDAKRARGLLEHVTAVLERMPTTAYVQNQSVVFAGAAVWELGAAEYAATYRRLTLDLLRAGVGNSGLGPLDLCLARMLALLDDVDGAETCFERARRTLDASGLTHLRAILDYDQALALLRLRSDDKARISELLVAASDAFHSLGMLGWVERADKRRYL